MPLIQTKFGKANINTRGYYDIVSRVEGNYKKKLHRLIYEDHYGVTLLPTTDIHHLDGNKVNNHIDNLEALPHSEHCRRHMLINNPRKGKQLTLDEMLKLSYENNSTGYYRVIKHKYKNIPQGFLWAYQYYDENKKRKRISRKTISELEKAVTAKGLIWRKLN